jgi:thioester reductase-like protein
MNKFFITGGTGVVGSAVVAELCANTDADLQLLIRAKDQHDLAQRRAAMLKFWEISPESDLARRITALRGDVTLPNFGLLDEVYSRVARETSHIIHSAAIVKMNLPLDEARQSAVSSVKSILTLAEQCRQHGVLQKVDIVSTVGVSGLAPGLMPEEPMLHVEKFHNSYEASKSEAERYVLGHTGQLPITLHRPSMVVGRADTGKIIHFQVFYHLCEFLSGKYTRGMIPKTHGVSLDTVPVDYVAKAIIYSALHPEQTKGKIFHLCSGPNDAIPIPALVSQVHEKLGGATISRPRAIPPQLFRGALPVMAWFVGEREKRALRNLPIFLDYLAVPQQFSNQNSKAFFVKAGIDLPNPSSYLSNVFGYYLSQKASKQS